MSEFSETNESAKLLREYFEAHEAAYRAMTSDKFAACMAAWNRAACALRTMPRPEQKVYL